MKKLKQYAPRTRQDALVLFLLCALGAGVVVWMHEDLWMVIEHWKVTLAVLAVGVVMMCGRLSQVTRHHKQVLNTLRSHPDGLTRAELATSLKVAQPGQFDDSIQYLLAQQSILWTERDDHLVLQYVEDD